MKMGFEGKVVLITGASSGIGADAARHLAKLGAKVSIVGRNEKRLNEVAEEIKKAGSPAPLQIVADVTKDTERIVNETIKHFDKLDVLVNNAGIGVLDSVVNVNLSEFDRVIDANVRAVITITKLCVPHLEKTKGNIVNVSSVFGMIAGANWMSYCMSKAAIDQFTKCSALDLASKKIRVNSVNPATIRTHFCEASGMSSEQYEQILEQCKDSLPIGRFGNVSDTSEAIAFLASDKSASFLTGILLPIDGGKLLA